jgi:hypothetical protein
MEYFRFLAFHDLLKDEFPNADAFYREMKLHCLKMISAGNLAANIEFNRNQAELLWIETDRPYYKIDNAAIELFRNINLDVPFSYLKLPFSAFVCVLQHDNPLQTAYGPIRSFLVSQLPSQNDEPYIFVWVDTGEVEKIPPHPPVLNFFNLSCSNDTIIANELGKLQALDTISDLQADKLEQVIFRLAISVAFLATGSDKMIRPDVLSKDLAAWLEAQRKGDMDRMKIIADRARRRGKNGFVVDAAREFLRPVQQERTEGTGRELSYRHVRSCHFRHYPSGLVTFVRQAIVRADLPTKS